MIKSPLLENDLITHGFFTREYGVSTGLYEGLNCGAGSDDDPEKVAENKRIAMQLMGLDETALATLYQIHSTDVVTVTSPFKDGERPKADAMVTRQPGIALGILTADCVPILFADVENGVIGAAHSGWKGTAGNISARVISAMEVLGARKSSIYAAVGPAIQQASYEVGPDFPAPFLALDSSNEKFFIPSEKTGHHMFDLTGFVKSQLENLGIAKTDLVDQDTCTEESSFFSYRRMYKRGEADYGRQLSAITLRRG